METVKDIVANSSGWLKAQQDDNGGWPDQPSKPANTMNTAEAMIALIEADITTAGHTEIKRGRRFLLRHQLKDGPDKGAWPREIHLDDGTSRKISDIVRTSVAIQALIKAGEGVEEGPMYDALDWLFSVRNDDHGWGYARGRESALIPTCFALMALLEAYDACKQEAHNVCKDQSQQQVREGLEYLVQTHYRAGPDEEVKGAFDDPRPLQAVHTIFGTLVLQAARRCDLSPYADEEREAVGWLLRHPDDAIRVVEEWIRIDPETGQGNYPFMFMTDALLLKVLAGSPNQKDISSQLAHEALNSLKDRRHPSTGAFYGSRVYTWSTAKALSALHFLPDTQYQKLPERLPEPPEHRGLRVGQLVLVFALVLSGLAAYLMYTQSIGALGFVFYAFLMLALLLALGMIGERSFVELAKEVFPNFGGKG